MTCKDCLYYECCSTLNDEFKKYPKDFIHSDLTVRNCTKFKNKADYAEVKHGEWIIVNNRDFEQVDAKCSICGYTDVFDETGFYKYCPNCGAKMDLKEGAEE